MPDPLRVTEFTDPGCPFAFSAEPIRWRLQWVYGPHLAWTVRLVVLTEIGAEPHVPPERMARNLRRLQTGHGMPIDPRPRARTAITEPACRAIVAARLDAGPAAERGLLRRLRVLGMGGALIDEPDVIARAAREAGLDPALLARRAGDPEVVGALRADMALARHPSPEAQALAHKLGCSGDVQRYTCPSYVFERGGARFTVPGFQPLSAYEVAIANLAPDLPRRDEPAGVDEVLAWAQEPLATVEVAAIMDVDERDARAELAGRAAFEPVGADGYWTRRDGPAVGRVECPPCRPASCSAAATSCR